MSTPITERGRLLEATSVTAGAVRRPIQIITPGWGSSGYYSAEVLQEAATNKVIPAGTHMYLNHASESERTDRPERDVRDIAAVLVEDARWDGQRLIAQADLLGANGELVEAIGPYIGVSISGSATDITIGEAEGRSGPIIEGLAHVASVDFVTHAGRGGKVLLESARPSVVNASAVRHGVNEATANDTRERLSDVLRDAYNGERVYVWVRDFDDTTVWFELESPDDSGLYAQTYTGDDGSVALTGERTEVRVVTTYVPVSPAGSNTTQESKEDTMPQIEEARLRELEEAAGRVTTLEERATTAEARATTAETALAAERAVNRARTLIQASESRRTSGVEFTSLEERGLLAGITLTEDGQLDEAAFTAAVDTAVTESAATRGAGAVTGFGRQPAHTGDAVTESAIDAAVGSAFGRTTAVKEA